MLLFVDHLTNVDFSYLHTSRGLLGETWLAHIELEGELDEQSMVCDFGIVKNTIRTWLDKELDHRLLVPSQAANLNIEQRGEDIELHWTLANGESVRCLSPRQAIALVETNTLTPRSVATWCIKQLKPQFPQTTSLKLSFTCEPIKGAQYQYSHGLKKHDGNCQRIAHGHRSKIRIEKNRQRSPELEEQWANAWRDIYLGTEADLQHSEDKDYSHFSYRAPQGNFELSLPKDRCYLLPGDSTVECIAQHIAEQLARQYPGNHFKVKAYEGLGKGAIATTD